MDLLVQYIYFLIVYIPIYLVQFIKESLYTFETIWETFADVRSSCWDKNIGVISPFQYVNLMMKKNHSLPSSVYAWAVRDAGMQRKGKRRRNVFIYISGLSLIIAMHKYACLYVCIRGWFGGCQLGNRSKRTFDGLWCPGGQAYRVNVKIPVCLDD